MSAASFSGQIVANSWILQSKTFTPAQRWPSSVKLNYREGVYTIDSLKSEMDLPEKNILLWLVSWTFYRHK